MPAVYIMTNKRNGTLYVGMSSSPSYRVWQHQNKILEGFTKKYALNRLVYYELYQTSDEALQREKKIKNWRRAEKIEIIEASNPTWKDLTKDLEELT